MQYPDDVALADAIASPDLIITPTIVFDWARDGQYTHPYSDLSWLLTSSRLDYPTLVSDLPAQIATVKGYSSAELTVVFGGARYADPDLNAEWRADLTAQGLGAHQLFSPYYTDSPLYGIDIAGTPVRYARVVETAAGDREVRQFTGWVRDWQINRDDNSVTMVCSDIDDMVSSSVTLPHWCVQPPNADSTLNPMTGIGVPGSLAWAVEETLRQGGRPTGPPARDDAVAYLTCNGTLLPSIGNIAWRYGQPYIMRHSLAHTTAWPWQEGRYGIAPRPLASANEPAMRTYVHVNAREMFTVPQADSSDPTRVVGISCWMHREATPVQGFATEITVHFDDWWTMTSWPPGRFVLEIDPTGGFSAWVREAGGGGVMWENVYAAPDPGWHYVTVLATITPKSVTLSAYLDDQLVTPTSTSGVPGGFYYSKRPDSTRPNAIQVDVHGVSVQHVQVFSGPEGTTHQPGQQHPPTREGRPLALPYTTTTQLSWIPDVEDRPAWTVLQEIVGAEFGVVHTNEHGQIIALTHEQVRQQAHDAITGDLVTITDDRLSSMILNPSLDAYANRISIAATDRYGVLSHVYTNPGPMDFYAEPGKTYSRIVSLPDVVTINTHIEAVSATIPGNDPDARRSLVTAVRADQLTTQHPGIPSAGGIAIDLAWRGPGRTDTRTVLIGWWLNAGQPAAYIGSYLGGNRPSFALAGVSYSDRNTTRTIVSDTAAIAARGVRAVEIEPSDWRQTRDSVRALAESLLADTTQPAPLLEPITIRADPRLQLRDVVRLTSETGPTGVLYAQIIGMTREDTTIGGSVDRLALRIIRTPGDWVLGDPDLSVLGATTILGG